VSDSRFAACDYDLLVNWERRLAREAPFFRELVRQHDVHHVLDCACGTGRHAALFTEWGLDVVGTDADPKMIAAARRALPKGPTFLECDFLSLEERLQGRLFDAVVCLGNSLPCLNSADDVADALRQMAALLRPGGLLVLHLVNLPVRVAGGRFFGGPRPAADPERDACFVKIFERIDDHVRLDIVQVETADGRWHMKLGGGRLLVIESAALTRWCEAAGFGAVQTYEGHDGAPFDAGTSDVLLLTALRGA
jgi:SAM-dependent methyltransferase